MTLEQVDGLATPHELDDNGEPPGMVLLVAFIDFLHPDI